MAKIAKSVKVAASVAPAQVEENVLVAANVAEQVAEQAEPSTKESINLKKKPNKFVLGKPVVKRTNYLVTAAGVKRSLSLDGHDEHKLIARRVNDFVIVEEAVTGEVYNDLIEIDNVITNRVEFESKKTIWVPVDKFDPMDYKWLFKDVLLTSNFLLSELAETRDNTRVFYGMSHETKTGLIVFNAHWNKKTANKRIEIRYMDKGNMFRKEDMYKLYPNAEYITINRGFLVLIFNRAEE
jgi:hypothetical protein